MTGDDLATQTLDPHEADAASVRTAIYTGPTIEGAPPTALDLGPRYALGEQIARGGMGTIHSAHDTVLGREVAVKILQSQFPLTGSAARRFGVEARITAQLQPPATPPIHDFGHLPDGRPFLVMKLIKGETLEFLLNNAADRAASLDVFEKICQAIAYAHDRNVIHRDLKPANVMVGLYGETQVMDWGLAKVLGEGADSVDDDGTAPGTVIVSTEDARGSATLVGSILGTPAFMPPEQAVGANALVDARSDVFGLGAILAVILTGRPPFTGDSQESTRVKAAQGNLAECHGRLDTCAADPEWVKLCKHCLAAEPSGRPANAAMVAKEIVRIRVATENRLKQAELEGVQAREQALAAEALGKEQRRRRRIVTVAAVALALVLAAGLTGTSLGLINANEARNAEASARQTAETKEAEAVVALAAEEQAHREADESAKLAFESLSAVTYEMPEILERSLFARSAREPLIAKLSESMEKQYALEKTRGLQSRSLMGIEARLGDIAYMKNKRLEAQERYQKALNHATENLAQANEFENRFERAYCHSRLGWLFADENKTAVKAEQQYRLALELYRSLVNGEVPMSSGDRPRAVLRLMAGLRGAASFENIRQQYAASLRYSDEALALAKEPIEDLTVVQKQTLEEAIIEIQLLRAESLLALSRNDDASAAYADCHGRYDTLIKTQPRNYALRQNATKATQQHGRLLEAQGKNEDALKAFEAAAVNYDKLTHFPELMSVKADHSRTELALGDICKSLSRPAETQAHYAKAIALRREIVDFDAANDIAKQNLAIALVRTGDCTEGPGLMLAQYKRFRGDFLTVQNTAHVLGKAAKNMAQACPPDKMYTLEFLFYHFYRRVAIGAMHRLAKDWLNRDPVTFADACSALSGTPDYAECLEIIRKRLATDTK